MNDRPMPNTASGGRYGSDAEVRAGGMAQERGEAFYFLAENMQDVVWISDPAGPRVLYVNGVYERIWGRPRAALYADFREWIAGIHPEDRERVRKAIAAEAVLTSSYDETYRVLRPDGTIRWVRDRGWPIRDASGAIRFTMGTAIDVTDRVAAAADREANLERERRRAARLQALTGAFLSITRAPTVETALAEITETARAVLGAHQAVTSLTRGPDWRQSVNAVSLSGRYAQWRHYDAAPDGSGIYAEVCRTNHPMRLTQAELVAHPLWRGFGKEAGRHPPLRGWLAAPLVARDGRNLGLIQLSDKDNGEFDAEDEAILVQMAQLASIAIERTEAEEALRESEGQFRTLADAIPQLAWMANPDGWIFWYNQRWYAYTGTTPEQMEGWGWQSVHDPAVLPQVLERWRASIATGEPFEMVFPLKGADGVFRPFLTRVAPVRNTEGRVVRWFGTNTDITEQRAVQESLRETADRLAFALEAARMGNWSWDAATDMVVMSERAAEIFGIAPGPRMTWTAMRDLLHPADRERVRTAVDAAIAERSHYDAEYRVLRPDGTEVWVAARGKAFYAADGGVLGMRGVVQDVTSRKRTEEHQQLLLHELNHRVKNTLATVQSIAMQTLRSTASPASFQEAFAARLLALSGAHDLLTRSAWQGAPIGEIVQRTLAPYGARASAAGPELQLNPNAAVTLSMAFHELATNAGKYGALSVPDGHVRVAWAVEGTGDAALMIRWVERSGPRVTPPTRRGFGTRLIERGVAHELDGEVRIDFAPAGVECTMRLPLSSARRWS